MTCYEEYCLAVSKELGEKFAVTTMTIIYENGMPVWQVHVVRLADKVNKYGSLIYAGGDFNTYAKGMAEQLRLVFDKI